MVSINSELRQTVSVLPHVVDRAGAFAHVQAGGESAGQVGLAGVDGVGKFHALGQRASDGG